MNRIIGIDLGTTNTCTAYVSNKIPRVIPTESGFNTIPSVVTYHSDGRVLVGQSAKEEMLNFPDRTLVGIKRLLGRQYNSRAVQALTRYFSYKIEPDEQGEACASIDSKKYSCADVQSQILKQIKRYAEINLGEDIPEVVIAVPAYYNDHQRSLVKEAGSLAGWDVKRIVNEPTAAALAYGFNRNFDQKILIYDLGGGTFDVSILEVTGNVFQVIATGGDMFLGGADFDARIQQWILEQFQQQAKIDLREDSTAMERVRGAAERVKIELSLLANTEIKLPAVIERRGKTVDLDLVLDRETLNDLTQDLVQETIQVVDKLLKESGIKQSEIEEVIPVGGQIRMPAVLDAVTNYFGKSPRKGIHPDECVAIGAALLGDSLSKIDAVTLLDTLSIPIGIPDDNGNLQICIDKNKRLPHSSIIEFPTTEDNQEVLELDIYQGEANTPVRGGEYLGTMVYRDLPSGSAGEIIISVNFKLDSEGMLSILVSNNKSDATQKITLATIERPTLEEEKVVEVNNGPGVVAPEPKEESGVKGLVRGFLGRR